MRIRIAFAVSAALLAAGAFAAEDINVPVRSIGVNGQEAWNGRATSFLYAPTSARYSMDATAGRQLSFAANANGCVTNLQVSGDMSGMNWVLVADCTQYAWIGADKAWGSGTLRLDGTPVAWREPTRRERMADEGARIVYAPAL